MITNLEQVTSFEFDKGWYKLGHKMLAELHALEEKFSIVQIKEKFAELRVYYEMEEFNESGFTRVKEIIEKYETRAWLTCEHCGSTDCIRTTKKGWQTRLCPICMKKLEVEK